MFSIDYNHQKPRIVVFDSSEWAHHGAHHVAPPCFYSSPEQTHQTLVLERTSKLLLPEATVVSAFFRRVKYRNIYPPSEYLDLLFNYYICRAVLQLQNFSAPEKKTVLTILSSFAWDNLWLCFSICLLFFLTVLWQWLPCSMTTLHYIMLEYPVLLEINVKQTGETDDLKMTVGEENITVTALQAALYHMLYTLTHIMRHWKRILSGTVFIHMIMFKRIMCPANVIFILTFGGDNDR